jgi:hypothetical protein
MTDANGDDEVEAIDDVQCALVEYVLGNVMTRKWTLALGQSYTVGRKESGADIEVDHASLSRRHCSLAVTRGEEDADLTLVVLDQGSTNGTFVDKCRLENGVGLQKKLAEFRFMCFGKCENGYRILVRGGPGESTIKGAAYTGVNKRGGPLTSEQKAQIARLKKLSGGSADDVPTSSSGNRHERREAAREQQSREQDRSRSRSPGKASRDAKKEWDLKAAKAKKMAEEAKRRLSEGVSTSGRMDRGKKDSSKSSWRADPDAFRARKGAGAKETEAEPVDIEWPEDWR